MIDFFKDLFIVLSRIITIIPLLFFMTLFMGKRALGQLPVFDFIIVLILGSLVGADIADPNIKHLPTAIAIVAIALFQRMVANWKISNRKIGKLLTLKPTVVIHNGKLLYQNIKKVRYSIDNILQMLREKNIFDINEVETAIIEADGGLSVLKKPQKQTITKEDMNIPKPTSSLALPVIVDGTMDTEVLENFNLNEGWLKHQLTLQGIHHIEDVFFASINYNHDLHVSLKDSHMTEIPPIKH